MGTTFNPFANNFQSSEPSPQERVSQNRPVRPIRRATDFSNISFVINQGIDFLRREHASRVDASNLFPQKISASQIRQSIARFEHTMSIASRDTVCCSCGMLVAVSEICRLLQGDPLLRSSEGFLDNCGCIDGFWNLCSTCYASILRGSPPKFSAKNKINVTLCQKYPAELEGLSLTEEYLVARSHPVGVVVKLRPGGQISPANYRALRGHFIVIPQEPKPLLRILPSPELRFTDIIKVFWLGKSSPTDDDMRPFFIVRKQKVLAALHFLMRHNPLYFDVAVNDSLMDVWPDDFIPSEIQQQIICLGDKDQHERAGYSVDLRQGNYENDWQAAEEDRDQPGRESLPITASISTDLNGDRQNPDLRLLNTVHSLAESETPEMEPPYVPTGGSNQDLRPAISQNPRPVITYGISGQASLLNQWQDPHFLTSAFPTLFPTGAGGHLDERLVPVSITAFANWALRHHSRR